MAPVVLVLAARKSNARDVSCMPQGSPCTDTVQCCAPLICFSEQTGMESMGGLPGTCEE